MADTDEDYYLPLQDQRVFGAGIRRKKINFVPASTSDSQLLPTSKPSTSSTSAASRYLAIVLPQDDGDARENPEEEDSSAAGHQAPQGIICAVCNQPISSTDDDDALSNANHETSIAHQVCLKHSHPPSDLDRDRVGLRYLSTYGWDPDSRRGLGAREEGIRVPIKTKEKNDTVGLRETADEDEMSALKRKKKHSLKKEDKIVKLDAKQVRLMDGEAKKRAAKLRQLFYGRDLEKYLGPNS
ncbi:uncharacterized protein Z520_00825 [Fonsecaea multimorphosa CBS 102226]|uniref:G-patch domain-containing protein n=1 Tax=Fonsecaea multimorphosa CBS 102226 TaxID=1442371 RepID=A0A0D2KDD6_9EURO|nr:uncharacterized protein Z520_00825 [Fonsecaea multimorphosa CBS 102226]KIY04133.1 hypothetical protein Z520_00825 [Fonsecaea multimorphosa CBS 102226]OAL31963.1 hypothetical protein AYO22_00833 [Fonsecaea multimorphosa]